MVKGKILISFLVIFAGVVVFQRLSFNQAISVFIIGIGLTTLVETILIKLDIVADSNVQISLFGKMVLGISAILWGLSFLFRETGNSGIWKIIGVIAPLAFVIGNLFLRRKA